MLCFKLTSVPYAITHPFDAPYHPTASRSRPPLKQSRFSFTATCASSTMALCFHGRFCSSYSATSASPNNRASLSRPLVPLQQWRCAFRAASAPLTLPHLPPQTIALLFHSHFCLPHNRATLRCRIDLPNNRATLRHADSPTEFTLTYMPQTQSHRSSPRPVIHLKRSLLPPIQSRRYITVTIASKHNHAACPKLFCAAQSCSTLPKALYI